jgi:hypothetical protein
MPTRSASGRASGSSEMPQPSCQRLAPVIGGRHDPLEGARTSSHDDGAKTKSSFHFGHDLKAETISWQFGNVRLRDKAKCERDICHIARRYGSGSGGVVDRRQDFGTCSARMPDASNNSNSCAPARTP